MWSVNTFTAWNIVWKQPGSLKDNVEHLLIDLRFKPNTGFQNVFIAGNTGNFLLFPWIGLLKWNTRSSRHFLVTLLFPTFHLRITPGHGEFVDLCVLNYSRNTLFTSPNHMSHATFSSQELWSYVCLKLVSSNARCFSGLKRMRWNVLLIMFKNSVIKHLNLTGIVPLLKIFVLYRSEMLLR